MYLREPQIVPKTDKRSTLIELARERRFARQNQALEMKTGFPLRRQARGSKSRTRGWVLNPPAGGAAPDVNCSDTISRTTETAD